MANVDNLFKIHRRVISVKPPKFVRICKVEVVYFRIYKVSSEPWLIKRADFQRVTQRITTLLQPVPKNRTTHVVSGLYKHISTSPWTAPGLPETDFFE